MPSSLLRYLFGIRRGDSLPKGIRQRGDYAQLERRVVYSAVALGDLVDVFADAELQTQLQLSASPQDGFLDALSENHFDDSVAPVDYIEGGEVLSNGGIGSISGTIFEDITGDGSVAGDGHFRQARLYLYYDDGDLTPDAGDTYVTFQDAASDGSYTFSGLLNGDYWVVVDSMSIRAQVADVIDSGLEDQMWVEQTYGPDNGLVNDGNGGQKFLNGAGPAFGGLNAGVSDNASRVGFAASDATPLASSEHLALVSVVNDSHEVGVDFGFSYNVVTTVRGGGDPANATHDDDLLTARTIQGSLRQFIQNANNYAGQNEMRFVPMEAPNATSTLDPTQAWWRIDVEHPFDPIEDAGTIIDGTAYDYGFVDGSIRDTNTTAVGSTETTGLGADSILGSSDDADSTLTGIPGGLELEIVATTANLVAGIESNASDTTIRNLSIHGFGDGNNASANVLIDGLGNAITGISVEGSLLGAAPDLVTSAIGNGSQNIYIDSASASVTDNLVVRANQFGIRVFTTAFGVVIDGNEIRSNGLSSNIADGVSLRNTTRTEIRNNLITDSGGYGIDSIASASNNLIENNTISSNGVLGTQPGGIRLFGQGSVVTNNLISNNFGDGVIVPGAVPAAGFAAGVNNLISRNIFRDNNGIAIDLGAQDTDLQDGDGISSNDGGTLSSSGNLGLDFPTQSPSVLQYDSLTDDLALTFATNVNLEMYAVSTLDPSDRDGALGSYHGEGMRFIRSYGPGNPAPIVYDTNQSFLPTDYVTYLAIDGNGNTSEFSVSYEVNFLPITSDDFFSTSGPLVPGNVISNDTDADGDAIQVSSHTTPSNAQSFAINPSGDFTYTPNAGFNGLDTFTYTASDGNGGTRDATVFITVSNTPPSAIDDSYTLAEDTSFSPTVGVDDLLLNDSDPDGESLTTNLVTAAANGTLALSTDGTFTYTPHTNFVGTDSFVYEAVDPRNGRSQATVTLNVTPTPDAPIATDDAYQVLSGSSFTPTHGVDDLLQNDVDPDGDALTVNLSAITEPSNGTLTLVSDGTFTYTPNSGFGGTDSFEYQIDDGTGRTANAWATIDVNRAPVALEDAYSGTEDSFITATSGVNDLLLNDFDPDTGDSISINTIPVIGPANGSVGIASDGSFTYVPNSDFFGTDSFIYEISDGRGGTAQATATLTIAGVNDAPVTVNDSYSVNEDTLLFPVLGLNDLIANDTDVDGDTLSVTTTPVTDVANGTLILNSDGTFQYSPNQDFNGTDSFAYEVTDGAGGSAIGVATITVNAVNDAPVATPDTYSVNEDNGLSVTAGVDGLLDNDTDVDVADTLSINISNSTEPSNGTLLLFGSGSFNYIPDPDFFGTDSFSYEVSDGNGGTAIGSVTINVLPINDAPIATNDHFTISEDFPLATMLGINDLIANDTDIENDPITVNTTPVTNVSDGTLVLNSDGSFLYTPDENYNGVVSFSYEISDGNGGTDIGQVTISVLSVNDAPLTRNDAIRLQEDATFTATLGTNDVLANDSDIENNPISVDTTPATLPVYGSVVLGTDGVFQYTPQADFFGVDTFTYSVSDGSDQSLGTVEIVVDPVQDIPIATDDVYTLDEDSVLSTTVGVDDLLVNDFDVDGDLLSVFTAPIDSLVNGPSGGSVTILADGTFTYTPSQDFFGVDTFVYQVTDGVGGTARATVTLTVQAVNDAPVVAENELLPVAYETTVAITTEDLSTTDVDDIPGNLIYTVSGLTHGHLEFTDAPGSAITSFTQADINNSRVVYVHTGPTVSSSDAFSFLVTDGSGATVSGVFNITIGPAPEAFADEYRVTPGKALFVGGEGVVGNDLGRVPSITTELITPPSNGSITWNSDGTFVYTPNAGFIGTETIVYQLSSIFGSDTTTITISVPPITQSSGSDGGSSNVGGNPDIVEIPVPLPPQRASETKSRQPHQEVHRHYRGESDGNAIVLPSKTNSENRATVLARIGGSRDIRELRSRYAFELASSFETGAFDVSIDIASLNLEMGAFLGGLDSFHESMMSSIHVNEWNVPRGLALTGGLSIGWILWTLKGGYLVGSLLSATNPTWSMVDPLPIFDSIDNEKNQSGEGDFLDEMLASHTSK